MGKKKNAQAKVAKAAAAENNNQENSQVLGLKEQQTWKSLVKFYEKKDFKKGIKCADQILATNPQHGETLAMKGLILNSLKQKEEAYKLVKQGLNRNIKSGVCWHVYGLMNKNDRKYDAAIKCYQNALRYDEQNLQILRDLANLQIQLRMISPFCETRRKILVLRPQEKVNWLAYAVAKHLCGLHEEAIDVLDKYKGTLTHDMMNNDYEMNELYRYKTIVLLEYNSEVGLRHLSDGEHTLKDRQFFLETQARVHLEQGSLPLAEQAYRSLLKRNPENYMYHYGLRSALQLHPTGYPEAGRQFSSDPKDYSETQLRDLVALYDELHTEYPRAAAVARLRLDFADGDKFRSLARQHLLKGFRRGIPSIFRDMKPLYSVANKRKVIEEIVLDVIRNLEEFSVVSADEADDGIELPSVLLWALYYASMHYDYLKQYDTALSMVNRAIEHTPTFIDLYVLRARIFKHAGNETSAFHNMDFARRLDLADRYLNTKCTRYAFRNGDLDAAHSIVGLFLKDADKLISLYDMQAIWYELHAGHYFEKKKEYGRALKMYHSVQEHFDDFEEDQFDFHSYCLRKTAICSYVDMLKWGESLRHHKYFVKGAIGAVRVYIQMYDGRLIEAEENAQADADKSAPASESLSIEDRRVAREERRRLHKQGKKADESAQKEPEKREDLFIRRDGVVDEDPYGEKLAATETPLDNAAKILRTLEEYSGGMLEVNLLAFEVHYRMNKVLLCLRALKRAHTINKVDPRLHGCIVRFFHKVDSGALEMAPQVEEVLKLERPTLDCDDARAYNEQYDRSATTLGEVFAVSKLKSLFNDDNAVDNRMLDMIGESQSWQEVCEVYEYLRGVDAKIAEEFRSSASNRFVYCKALMQDADREKAMKEYEEWKVDLLGAH